MKKLISILGDSISTFEGYSVHKSYTYYSPRNAKYLGLESVEDTYWHMLVICLLG